MENVRNSQKTIARFSIQLKHANRFVVFCTLLFLAIGCTIPEDERCAGDYEWDPSYQLCLKISNATEDATPQPNGVGTPCTTDAECIALGQAVDYCILDPFSVEPVGICSVLDCVATDCTGPHACCDCTSIETEWVRTDVSFCVPTSRESLLKESLGCSCE
ncbi:MAG: hypothetical protein JXX14_13555 [Deltaproteobacteria bacterium]|nr:hypothetical protein [Deltaproteobacteria bacterium]